jgi:hypothetical protein
MLTVEHLTRALSEATRCSVPSDAPLQALHQARSREWVRCLAGELKRLYSDDPDVRVFHKGDDANRAEFGLNELLYDVCVCRTAECPSARQGKTLRYVTKALWQAESEFARDSAEALKDFNKLVIGAADNKLFVGPRLTVAAAESAYLEALLPAARSCTGAVYSAFVPHPDAWPTPEAGVIAWRLTDGRWQPV